MARQSATKAQPKQPEPSAYWPTKRGAELLHVSTDTIRRRIADGSLPAYRVGGQLRVRADDVERLAVRVPTVGGVR